MASTGLRQVAEVGGTRKLESELKDEVRNIYIQHLDESSAKTFSPSYHVHP